MKVSVKNLIVAALLLVMSVALYKFFGSVTLFGGYLCVMQAPILLCGLLCGPILGGLAGVASPFICSLLFSSPQMYPDTYALAVEFLVFGVLCGVFYKAMYQNAYVSLILAMYIGKTAYGLMMRFLAEGYSSESFLNDIFYDCIPGIVIIIVILPLIAILLDKTGLMRRGER